MDRDQLLAAEVFGYSFARYHELARTDQARYEQLMPEAVRKLETAKREGWPRAKVATELGVEPERAGQLLEILERARLVVDADTPGHGFQNGIRLVVQEAIAGGLEKAESIEELIAQVCVRVTDLVYRLETTNGDELKLTDELRRQLEVDVLEGYGNE